MSPVRYAQKNYEALCAAGDIAFNADFSGDADRYAIACAIDKFANVKLAADEYYEELYLEEERERAYAELLEQRRDQWTHDAYDRAGDR